MSQAGVPGLPSDLSLRELGSEDAAASAALISACDQTYIEYAPAGWTPPSEESERERWREILAEPARIRRGAFDESGKLVALFTARQEVEDDVPLEGVGHVGALFVHPSRWREGNAAAMLAEGERLMREQGLRQAKLRTPEWAPARHFYEAQGWSMTGEREFQERWDMWTVTYEKSLA